jgi:hypothetical protein
MCYCDGNGFVSRQVALQIWTEPDPEYAVLQPPRRLPLPPVAMAQPCGDCAFREGSPEMETGNLLAAVAGGEPFFCHHGMHQTRDGRYLPVARDAARRRTTSTGP